MEINKFVVYNFLHFCNKHSFGVHFCHFVLFCLIFWKEHHSLYILRISEILRIFSIISIRLKQKPFKAINLHRSAIQPQYFKIWSSKAVKHFIRTILHLFFVCWQIYFFVFLLMLQLNITINIRIFQFPRMSPTSNILTCHWYYFKFKINISAIVPLYAYTIFLLCGAYNSKYLKYKNQYMTTICVSLFRMNRN